MSRVVGALCRLEAGANVCGRSPVRTIGGCRRVEIAEVGGYVRKESRATEDRVTASQYHFGPLRIQSLTSHSSVYRGTSHSSVYRGGHLSKLLSWPLSLVLAVERYEFGFVFVGSDC